MEVSSFSKWRICTSRRHTCFSDATTVWVPWHGVCVFQFLFFSFCYCCCCSECEFGWDFFFHCVRSTCFCFESEMWVWSMRNDTKTKCSYAYQAPTTSTAPPEEEETNNGRQKDERNKITYDNSTFHTQMKFQPDERKSTRSKTINTSVNSIYATRFM